MGSENRGGDDDAGRGAAFHGASELNETLADFFRKEYGRAVAVLTRILGDITVAEDAVQEAFAIACDRWPRDGMPPVPQGWLIATARNKALDRLRRESSREERERQATALLEATEVEEYDVRDDSLRLIFTCCHPAIAPESQVALTLRLLGGLATSEVARAFLVPEATMGQRLSRAKAKIRNAGIPYRIPELDELPGRLAAVLAVIYLIFNEGYSGSNSEELLRPMLCDEAIRLGRLLTELAPDQPEGLGLLALMLLIDARRDARTDGTGAFVALGAQNRADWDEEKIDEGRRLLRICLERNRPGPYQLQAAINAVHCDAPTARETDWPQILQLYDQLLEMTSSSVVSLNRVVALAEVEGPAPALAVLETLRLDHYYLYHAVRADLLRRIGRTADAASAYLCAMERCGNLRERDFLERSYRSLGKN